MFKITLRPDGNMSPDALQSVSVSGDSIIINGETFDFSPLQEGDRLINSDVYRYYVDEYGVEQAELIEPKAVASDFIVNDVVRSNGYICLELKFPAPWNAPYSTRFPNPRILTIATDGPVPIPSPTPVEQ